MPLPVASPTRLGRAPGYSATELSADSLAAVEDPAKPSIGLLGLETGPQNAIERFVASVPLVDILAEAIASLCGSDPTTEPGNLRRVDLVAAALADANVLQKLAGRLSHAAKVVAAKLTADAPFTTASIADTERKRLIDDAIKKQAKISGAPKPLAAGLAPPLPTPSTDAQTFAGAQALYAASGLHPQWWGVSKAQLELFLEQARAVHALGHITNVTPADTDAYPQSLFDSPIHGPTIHQVVARVVKPATRACIPLAGVSWALKMNLHRGGLKCDLVFAHSWDEGIYAFGRRALAAWPDDVEGAYICFLSHPQHFDIDGRLHASHAPLHRALHAEPPPCAFVLLASERTPLLGRLWVLLEAFAAAAERDQGRLGRISVQGRGLELLAGGPRAALEQAEAEAAQAAQALHALQIARVEREASALPFVGDAREVLFERLERATIAAHNADERLARLKLDLVLSPSAELVDVGAATCTVAQDRIALREHVRGREDSLCRAVAAIVRQSLSGAVSGTELALLAAAPGASPGVVPSVSGPLGLLPLEAPTLSLEKTDVSSAPKAMHLAQWLWSRPQLTTLDLRSCASLAPEVPPLLASALTAGALPSLVSANLDGAPLPIPKLSGAEPTESLDLSRQRLSLASGLIVASLLETNSARAILTSLSLGHNPLRDAGVEALAVALRENSRCRLRTLELPATRLGVHAAKELAVMLTMTGSLTCLDLSDNRLCNTYADAYGHHGHYDPDGIKALAEALPRSSLTTFLVGGNGLRDEGAVALAAALIDPRCQLLQLDVPNDAIGVEGARALAHAISGTTSGGASHHADPPHDDSEPPSLQPPPPPLSPLTSKAPPKPPPKPPRRPPPVLASLDVSSNMICGVATLSTADGPRPPEPYSSAAFKALIGAVRRSPSLTHLSLANNRLCGIWSDAFGGQTYGTWEPEGVALLSDLIRSRAQLSSLDISRNLIGATGGKILFDALRDCDYNANGSSLRHVDMRHSRLDAAAAQHLAELASKRPTLSLVLTPN